MRNSTIVLTLALGLAFAAPGFGASQAPGGVHFVMTDGSVRLGVAQGPLTIRLEKRGDRLLGELRQGGRTAVRQVRVSFVPAGCGQDWPEGWRGARASLREPAGGGGRVEIRALHPRVTGCTLVGKLPPSGAGGASGGAGETAGSDPVGGKGPDAGGPDQGIFKAPLADLRIRRARVAHEDRAKLVAIVANEGPGSSDATQVKLYYHLQRGRVLTGAVAVPALAAGQQQRVLVGVARPLAAADKLLLRVDDPNQVAEADETNNSFEVDLD